MPVNLAPPRPESLLPISGVRLGVTQAGIRKANRTDLLVLALVTGSKVVGAFTQNRFCAAPVVVAREHLAKANAATGITGLVVNTGNANAGTGPEGLRAARLSCKELARLFSCQENQILPFSTGVIMEALPVERIIAALPNCIADLKENNWFNAAQAIMTTDTCPKAISSQVELAGKTITITGIAKGAGMIHPNMATMLGFIATDAAVAHEALQTMLNVAMRRSFNRITIDGDTSTNDAFVLIATGKSGVQEVTPTATEFDKLSNAVTEISIWLAQAIVRDGEGATKFMTITVQQGKDEAECDMIAYSIAHSPLVKTAFFASDPNLGRILAAIGYAGVADLDVSRIDLYLDDVLVVKNGARSPEYQEPDAQRVMKKSEIEIRVVLGRGQTSNTVWTCDLSHDYVSINADYRS